MLLALLLAAGSLDASVQLDGKAIAFPPTAQLDGGAKVSVGLLVSAELPVLEGTLIERGWTPREPVELAAGPDLGVTLAGQAPELELSHAGARIDERLRLLLWRRPERVRGLPLWVAVPLKQAGIRPLQPPRAAPQESTEARDRVLADVSYGLAQTRSLEVSGPGHRRLPWLELVEAPPGAEELTPDVPRSEGAPEAAGLVPAPVAVAPVVLAPLPERARVSAEVISRPAVKGQRVALTFDACSTLDHSFYDERVTHALTAAKAKATLFISGRWAETHLQQMAQLAKEPLFEIANHSYIHPHMTDQPPERQREELLWTQQILLSLTGKLPRFFRPPYGEVDPALAQVAAEEGLRTVEFDFASGDPDRRITKARLVAWVLAKTRPGSIVVMHMNRHGWHTAEALPEIIQGLRAKGFSLATVGELVDEAR